jgi:hypothetical protein
MDDLRRSGQPATGGWERAAGRGLALLALLFIGVLTLRPAPPSFEPIPVFCVICGQIGGADLLQNLLLFVPLGVGLGLARVPVKRAILLAGLTTLTVETLQFWAIPGRDASIMDLVSNTVGGALGVWLGRNWRSWLLPRPERAGRIAGTALLVWVAVVVLTTAAQRPAPLDAPLVAKWAPTWLETFHGKVVSVRIGELALPNGPVADTDLLWQRLFHDRVPLHLVVITGPRPRTEVSIVQIDDTTGRQLMSVGQNGGDLILDMHTLATRAYLRMPRVVLPGVVPEVDATHRPDTLRITGGPTGAHLWLRVEGGGRSVRRDLAIGPGSGWIALYPFGYARDSTVRLVSALWAALLLAPVGYWAGRSPAGGGWRVQWEGEGGSGSALMRVLLLAGAMLVGLAIVPRLLGLSPAPGVLWLVALAGAGVGWVIGRVTLGRGRLPPANRSWRMRRAPISAPGPEVDPVGGR